MADEASQQIVKREVPKFGSFKPKSEQSTSDASTPETAVTESRERSSRHKKHRRDRHERRKEHKKHREHRRRSCSAPDSHVEREHHNDSQGPLTALKDDEAATAAGLYTVDRRGDPDNIKFGSLHKHTIPLFKTEGFGRVLGLRPGLKIDRHASNEKALVLGNLSLAADGRRPLYEKTLPKDATKRLVKRVQDHAEPDGDMIPLLSHRKRIHDRAFSNVGNDEDADFRSIEGKAKSPQSIDSSDLEDENDHNKDGSKDLAARELTLWKMEAELEARVKHDPIDLEGWLELVKLEVPLPLDVKGVKRGQIRKDREHAIVDKALKSMPFESLKPEHETVIIGLMDRYRRTKDTRPLDKWKEILQKSQSIRLWMRYLDGVQSTSKDFTYETCRSTYFEVLKTATLHMGNEEAQKDGKKQESIMHILVRLTQFTFHAGYQEQALAVWQALFELCLSSGTWTKAEALSRFEQFWDEEYPRIGEKGSRGWQTHIDNSKNGPAQIVVGADWKPTEKTNVRNFGSQELDAGAALMYPGRISDRWSERDPFHWVMFSDISDYLEPIPFHVLDIGILIDAFALFCECLLPGLSGMSTFLDDPFLYASCSKENGYAQPPTIVYYKPEPLALFLNCSQMNCPVLSPEFVASILQRTAEFDSPYSEAVGEYLIAFQCKFATWDVVRKTAKALIKRRPGSIRLYNAFALAHHHFGQSESADAVLLSAMQIQNNQSDEHHDEHILLRQSRTLLKIQATDLDTASEVLRPTVDKEAAPSHTETGYLRARSVFRGGIQRTLYAGKDLLLASYIECLALLEYLSSRDLAPALAILQSQQDLLLLHHPDRHIAVTFILQAKARLITAHLTLHRPFQPRALRATLVADIHLRPWNSLLLDVFALNEARFSIVDRRDAYTLFRDPPFLDLEQPPSTPSFIHYLHAVRAKYSAEMSPDEYDASILNMTRNFPGRARWGYSPALCLWGHRKSAARFDAFRAKPPEKLARNTPKCMEDLSRLHSPYIFGYGEVCPGNKHVLLQLWTETMPRLDNFGDDFLWPRFDVMVERGLRVRLEAEVQKTRTE